MSLKSYEVIVPGRHPHKTTLLLSDEDATRMGVIGQHEQPGDRAAAKKKTPPNKAKTPNNKAAKQKSAPKKPAEVKPAAPAQPEPKPQGSSIEDASDPDASE